ncbi:TetR/AcrR family transcriptional regulator [Rhizohabitans arisaemae]|uniref:TetR/AcrR family transcriptional regulator n=1 Tax=Rhizohabitans arisaemae TaxID=2720610 RepID=UPI0024B1629D|nr:TetR family transcriptional regulator C-terminal domain-containing protein [Rhizohabitans arisaemae]
MPKIVDHAVRRQELVDACLRVVSRLGLAGTTTREISREAGVSHGIIAHYFSGKDDVLRAALQRSYELLAERIRVRIEGLTGAHALRQALLESLPVDEASVTGEQIELAFWSYSLGNPALADERWRSYSQWRLLLEVLVRDAQTRGELTSRQDPTLVAEAFIALIDGLGAQAALYPDRLPPERQRAIVDSTLQAYGMTLDPDIG